MERGENWRTEPPFVGKCAWGEDFSTGPLGLSRESVEGQGGYPFLSFGSPPVASLLR